MKTLVLGLGNRLLSDDAVGLLVAQEVRLAAAGNPDIDVRCGEVAGFRLVDMIAGYDKAIVVDAIISDRAPAGQCYWLDLAELRHPLKNLSNHNIHLADALDLGKGLGLKMPKEIKVLAVEVEDCYTLAERIGAVASAAVQGATAMVLEELGI
ncbi:MAG TPA: hydrogenase maturation protease [Acidobacteriota bacterium]|nr:hydrogenase maturation protease [Acidobacteriota bacterium]